MRTMGCHLSSSKGFFAMGKEAVGIGANTFQFFTRNPRGGNAKKLDAEDIAAYLSFAREHGIHTILAHAPYTLNPCAASQEPRTFAFETMADDLSRLEHLPGNYYNVHPGSHVKRGAETGIGLIADCLNRVLKPELKTTIPLETMSGKGSEVGGAFEGTAQ